MDTIPRHESVQIGIDPDHDVTSDGVSGCVVARRSGRGPDWGSQTNGTMTPGRCGCVPTRDQSVGPRTVSSVGGW